MNFGSFVKSSKCSNQSSIVQEIPQPVEESEENLCSGHDCLLAKSVLFYTRLGRYGDKTVLFFLKKLFFLGMDDFFITLL